ncbi:hypothetical protein GCM10025868_45540 [Angustibacter aerolatus]|uniref:D-alanyl-D-alanine carboxypeptidase-like core domain-containing protein n=1 Tax=Angustibacter aerolatus TaxID=1162965 RepID=A0ABQ6JPQ3_9ACTN|nr:M15 family metallopeptidase [Angustibacter aerolatus]GMA89304.1 hypothetical protein GCM10025868_45540 [Angustibacter aerolatus]
MATYERWLDTVEHSGSTTQMGHDLALLQQVGVIDARRVQEDRPGHAAAGDGLAGRVGRHAGGRCTHPGRRGREAGQEACWRSRSRRSPSLEVQQASVLGGDLSAQQQERLKAAVALVQASGGTTGACAGLDVSRFPNGSIPTAALCPLWGAPGHRLRADAAAAFERLSKAYAKQFGTPVCVTDSYRTLAEQVRLAAVKPRLAARPGTSNHGWGTATDLCGGIQSFGTAQHAWMLGHAPLYGFFLPSLGRPDRVEARAVALGVRGLTAASCSRPVDRVRACTPTSTSAARSAWPTAGSRATGSRTR